MDEVGAGGNEDEVVIIGGTEEVGVEEAMGVDELEGGSVMPIACMAAATLEELLKSVLVSVG